MTWSGLPKRIENKILPEPNSGCWIWEGALRDKDGYGGARWKGKIWRTHRLVYVLLYGPISNLLTIDHLCRNRICCNPEHLEVVTRKVNILRGIGIAPKNAAKTHCSHGHAYTIENLYTWNNRRACRICRRKNRTTYRKKKRNENRRG